MILDAHCHVWERWPYQPPVPDAKTRASPEHLLFEMDQNGVEKAILIAAAIGDNPDNAEFAFAAAQKHAARFVVFPDLECFWSPAGGEGSAVGRLEKALGRWDFCGFTLYLGAEEDGSRLTDPEGAAFFDLAAETGLIASLSVLPRQIGPVIALARRLPRLTILLHHFAFLGPRSQTGPDTSAPVLAAAACPNIVVKYSGMGNVAAPESEYPYGELGWIPRQLAQAFGPDRIVWGSDWPVSRRHMTYRQSLSLLTRHGPFPAQDLRAATGETMSRLIAAATQKGKAQ